MREIIGKERLRTVPSQAGVYWMTGTDPATREPRVLYVGKSINLRRRLASYRGVAADRSSGRLVRLASAVDAVTWETCEDDPAACLRENALLRLHRPRFNSANTHPESHWFAALHPGEDCFELSRRREAEGHGLIYGAFKHSTSFGALLRALWLALNPSGGLSGLPVCLADVRSRTSFRFDWGEANGDGAALQTLLRMLVAYLDGSSPDLLGWLREQLSPAMAQSSFARAWLAADLETLGHFFNRATRRNADLRRRFKVAGTILPKVGLDDLLARARATHDARKHAVRPSN